MKHNKAILVVALGLVLLAVAAPSYAIPILRLSADGGPFVEIHDQVVGEDTNPTVGVVTFIGPVGAFNINVSTGATKPILGSTFSPSMDLNSLDISSAGGTHALVVEFSDTDFGPVNSTFDLGIGGTTIGTILYQAFLAPTNENFLPTILLGSVGTLIGPTFSGSTSSSLIVLGGPYSLTQRATINITGSGATSFNATLAVPEPGPLLLLGTGLLSVGLLGWRLNR